jgi:hypothetical protein
MLMQGSFIWGGFEGASHRRMDGHRVDSVADSHHDRWALLDHAILRSLGVTRIRESLRWHLIEQVPGEYDFSSAVLQIRAARAANIQVVWGICHWGVPDHVDVMSACFPRRLASFAAAAVRALRAEGAAIAGWVPINEMAFWAWAGGQTGGFAPFLVGQGDELKRQLVRGHLAVVQALRAEGAYQPILVCEPLIWIVADEDTAVAAARARSAVDASFAAIDSILAQDPSAIDIVGLNHYQHNQWTLLGRPVMAGDFGHRPLRDLLQDAGRRFSRPLVLAETGAEDPMGEVWLDYVAVEAAAALRDGVQLEAICVYPIMDYPGWDNARHCPCGPIGHSAGRRFVRAAQVAALRKLSALRV